MTTIQNDITIIRELAKQYMEVALSDKHVRMRQRFRDTNDLKIVRPPVIMDEIPWHEMNYEGALDCICQDDALRGIEWGLRMWLFREKYFKCDNFIEPVWRVYKSYSDTGIGFSVREDRLAVDDRNSIVSHHYHDVFEDERELEKYHDPVITPYPEQDKATVARLQEILGDIIPVVLQGHGMIYHSPWDTIAMMRGMEPILMDMYDNPEYLHKIIGLFTRAQSVRMDQMEAYGLYDSGCVSLHCTPGDVTPPANYDTANANRKCLWFRTMAQGFSTISPAMHDEFDLQYSRPLAARCGYTYYGCCEPLHDRVDYLKKAYPNLRKVGVSPWADIEKSAEALGGDYVYSRKPNPAHVARVTDPDPIRKEITDTVTVCQKYGCPVDFTLKDISTVGYRPENLMVWAQTVSDVLDEYYGEA